MIVYAGPNASGKSTTWDIQAESVDLVIDPDRLARAMTLANKTAADIEAGKEAIHQFNLTLSQGHSLSWETALTGRTVLARTWRAKGLGYEVSLF